MSMSDTGVMRMPARAGRSASWLLVAVAAFAALTLSGCLKRTEDSAEVAASGECVARHVAVFDTKEVLAALKTVGLGTSKRALLSAEDLKGLEKRRREEISDLGETKIVTLMYTQDAAKGEVTEALTLRAASMQAWLRMLGTSSSVVWTRMDIDEASMTVASDGICTFSQKGRVGCTSVQEVRERMAHRGPPLPARAIPTSVSITVPGDAVGADKSARVSGKTGSWKFSAEPGSRGSAYALQVRFQGGKGVKPFHLNFDDIQRQAEEAEKNEAEARRLGPLSGKPLEDHGYSLPRPAPSHTLTAPEGTTAIKGRVMHGDRPVRRAVVSFMVRMRRGSYGSQVSVGTDRDGYYTVPGLWPGEYGVQVHVARHGRWLPDLKVTKGGPVSHDITLGTKSLKARLVDTEGKPVPGAIVWVHADHGQFVTFDCPPHTDAKGEVTIPYIAPGKYSLSASMEQSTSAVVETVVGAEGEPKPVSLQLESGYGRVEIQVRGKDGSGQQAYVQYLHPDGSPGASGNTDKAGRKTLYLTPGTWLIGLTTSRMAPRAEERFQLFAERVEVKPGKTVSITLTRPDPKADGR